MMPGGRMNERNMRLMMKRMGMSTETLPEVEEVIIRRAKDEVVITDVEVNVVTVQGVKTYQIVGQSHTRAKGSSSSSAPSSTTGAPSASAPTAPSVPEGPPEEDVQLVMDQAQVDHPTALRALKEANGEPAEAILRLLSKRKA